MFKKLFSFVIFSLCFMSTAYSERASKYDYWTLDIYNSISTIRDLKEVSLFDGDSHGDFKNDFVATLSDGSAWKVHPDDTEKFSAWQLNDQIYVHARRSRYWFKREHNLELYNIKLNESVKAMLVEYPQEPLYVTDVACYIADRYLRTKEYVASNGKTFEVLDWILESDYKKDKSPSIWTAVYRTKVTLSDGSSWLLFKKPQDNGFVVGEKAYVSANRGCKCCEVFFFLIHGIERDSKWKTAILVDSGL